ncbi:MAG: MgtC/SapB family protein [Candidatus Aenigmarchaeota archaeon]|nr:MgtC/SapB family protein [Candidatus Aenigmarchaeota archaeon]
MENIVLIIIALLLSSIIGWEREKRHKPAGLRTHVLVCISTCALVIITKNHIPYDYARIIQGIITGIGFIGAGSIIAQRKQVVGITTAASILFVAVLGIIIGLGEVLLAIFITILSFLILKYFRLLEKRIEEE